MNSGKFYRSDKGLPEKFKEEVYISEDTEHYPELVVNPRYVLKDYLQKGSNVAYVFGKETRECNQYISEHKLHRKFYRDDRLDVGVYIPRKGLVGGGGRFIGGEISEVNIKKFTETEKDYLVSTAYSYFPKDPGNSEEVSRGKLNVAIDKKSLEGRIL